jgi:hypothetical protein
LELNKRYKRSALISFEDPGADPGFQVRGDALKKNALAEAGAKILGVKFSLSAQVGIDKQVPGADPGGGARPPKIEKNMILWRKIVIFHTKYPQNFRACFR